ncbi:uncharacterized protein LOC129602693 [Paramacrobiotus metropolitanus]|uniref:uncharacterized protein LOC129602693 n=1 Tax=Paramacrobiotus metropolitanus TaxID=2943436 RepID=UPI002445B389|nr:uncharacterized protein LOC129602693 [Paramacrobiotus metropolitanus]
MGNGSGIGATGGTQLFCGLVLILIDIINMGMYYGISWNTWMPLIFGIFYVITGSFGVTAGNAANRSQGSARCLAITSLVMSILSILNSFALIIYTGILVAGYSVINNYSGGYYYFDSGPLGFTAAALVFFLITFIVSIVNCVMATRVMSSSPTTTTVTHVTHVVQQPGMVYGVQQQYPGQPAYPGQQPYPGAQPYPAGQPAPYPPKV